MRERDVYEEDLLCLIAKCCVEGGDIVFLNLHTCLLIHTPVVFGFH